jgi:Acetyl xylan esterase (AXE1)
MPAPTENMFLNFIRHSAAVLRAEDRAPRSQEEWNAWREQLRRNLQMAWGPFPAEKCELKAEKLGELERDDVRIEKIIFQTMPDVWMTANAYIPKQPGKRAAVLNVHGHWKGAKQDPHVQARCLGLAKLGFVALAVDAYGSGERALGKKLGEYHGEMVAGTLWPTGLALAGLQVYENMRAVDYLLTRPEVDGEKLGITGASGGGNQTMYAGAWDERFKAVVPVCSVGNYQAYLGPVCCMCEVVPGVLQFSEEWGVLSLVAPRALMVINASKDSIQFSIGEAQKSLRLAQSVFDLQGRGQALRHTTFDSPHDYNQAMREAMYGWMKLHLLGEGDGSPTPEPKFTEEDPEALRCYPQETRPENYTTIPRFAARVGKQLVSQKAKPDHLEYWESEAYLMRESLERLLGNDPEEVPLDLKVTDAMMEQERLLEFTAEPGIRLSAKHLIGTQKRWAIVVHAEGQAAGLKSDHAQELLKQGWQVICPDLRATGTTAVAGEGRGRAPDHNSAQWSLWIGRPLAGQWAFDIRRTLAAMQSATESVPEEIFIVGIGSACVSALLAAIQEENVSRLSLVEPLVSYVTDVPYERERMGSLIPGVLRYAGDIQHLAALMAPKRLQISGGVLGAGKLLDVPQIEEQFGFTRNIFKLHQADNKLQITASLAAAEWAKKISEKVGG